MDAILSINYQTRESQKESWLTSFSQLLVRIFGCWHSEMSRPFNYEGKAHRTCLSCGAHRRFDPQNWEMVGPFYYAAPTREVLSGAQQKSTGRVVKFRLQSASAKAA